MSDSEVVQYCTLLIADSDETEALLIETYGLTGTNKIQVTPGFHWKREFRNEQARDIYVIRMDNKDLEWVRVLGNPCSPRNAASVARQLYRRYVVLENGRRSECWDTEFDVIVIGTSDFLCKLKHRALGVTDEDFIQRL